MCDVTRYFETYADSIKRLAKYETTHSFFKKTSGGNLAKKAFANMLKRQEMFLKHGDNLTWIARETKDLNFLHEKEATTYVIVQEKMYKVPFIRAEEFRVPYLDDIAFDDEDALQRAVLSWKQPVFVYYGFEDKTRAMLFKLEGGEA